MSREKALSAKHEAAHAVVSVRVGLPLASTDIRQRRQVEGNGSTLVNSAGFTTLEPGTTSRWRDALPDQEAITSLTLFGTQAAAGIVADINAGLRLGDVSHLDDVQQLVQIAGILGIGESNEDPAVCEWMAARVKDAGAALISDDGAAWDRVRVALARKRCLTGDEVLSLVQLADGGERG